MVRILSKANVQVTVSSLVNRFTDNPDPALVVASLLLSLLTGNLLGNSIIQAGKDEKSCPEGYQIVKTEKIYLVRERLFSSSGEDRVNVKDGYYCKPEAGGGGSGGNISLYIVTGQLRPSY